MSKVPNPNLLDTGRNDQAGPSSGYQLRDRDMLCPPQRLRSSVLSNSPLEIGNVPCVDYDRSGLFQTFESNLQCAGDETRASIELGPHRQNQKEESNPTIICVEDPSPSGQYSNHNSPNLHNTSSFGTQNRIICSDILVQFSTGR